MELTNTKKAVKKYFISRLRNTDVLYFNHKNGVNVPKETDLFYFNIFGGQTVLRSKNELRAAKNALLAQGKDCKIKGIEPLLCDGAELYDITVYRSGTKLTFEDAFAV